MSEFDQVAQDRFSEKVAVLLGVSKAEVALDVTAGSIKVTSAIQFAEASGAMAALRALVCPTEEKCGEASTALGVTVETLDEPSLTFFSPPSPPPPQFPPNTDNNGNLNTKSGGESKEEGIALAVGLSVGVLALLCCVCAIAWRVCKKRKEDKEQVGGP